jgi:PKD repeat protein
MGIESATIFTFTAQGVSDPDSDPLTFSWTSSDGVAVASSTQAAAHVYQRSGTFDMKLIATDSKGLSTSATVSVTVGNLTGTWDITCDNIRAPVLARYPNFPRRFVASTLQLGASLSGTLSASGLSRTFPAPPSLSATNNVSDPKRATFGVEAFYNVWAPSDGDFYFGLAANDTLTAMAGAGGNYCGSSVASRR